MKDPIYKPGDILYYVNPFVFFIDKVMIQFVDPQIEQNRIYYIDNIGAYLLEEHLTPDLAKAKGMAMLMLNDFIERKQYEIWNANPELLVEEHD